jgi:hypothetical protein
VSFDPKRIDKEKALGSLGYHPEEAATIAPLMTAVEDGMNLTRNKLSEACLALLGDGTLRLAAVFGVGAFVNAETYESRYISLVTMGGDELNLGALRELAITLIGAARDVAARVEALEAAERLVLGERRTP